MRMHLRIHILLRISYSLFVPKTKSINSSQESHPAARQQRSRLTEARLLSAAARVVDREGLAGATVPRIAAAAKVASASVYRRFADKEDLLRAAVLHSLEAANTSLENHLRSEKPYESLGDAAGAAVAALVKQRRQHSHLLRTLQQLLEADPPSAFLRRAKELASTGIAHTAEALLGHRDSIRHPDPDLAARFAVISVLSAIEAVALDDSSLWHAVLPLSDKNLIAELTRQMVAYLRRKP